MAPTPASQKANTPASYEAIDLTNVVSDAPRNAEQDLTSAFGGSDFDEENERFLDLIDETLCQADGFGPPIGDKIAKIVNEKFTTDLSDQRKVISISPGKLF